MSVWRGLVRVEGWALLVTAWGGYVGSPAWLMVALCTAVLIVCALLNWLMSWRRSRSAGCEGEWLRRVAATVIGMVGVSGAAFMFGMFVTFVWRG